ncbi:MAG: hypothetical protein IT317_15315 [Anaerolineales bacterium]|nr:hypothetical protein [Anaerolineales bacterium]
MSATRFLPSRDRLSVLTAMIVLAYALARFLDLPARTLTTTLFGSPLGLDLDGPLLMLVLVAALISAGADTLIRSHPTLAGQIGRRTFIHWILPGATAIVLGAALNQLPDGPLWWLGLVVVAVALIAVLVAEYTAVDRNDAGWDLAALGLTALAYAVALVLFALLRSLSVRALVSATVSGMVAAALAWRLLALKVAPSAAAALHAAVVGLVVAEAIWAINYWRVSPGSAGLLAMIPFYLAIGLAQQHLVGRLTARLWIEYVVVGGLALAIALFYSFGQG